MWGFSRDCLKRSSKMIKGTEEIVSSELYLIEE